MKSGERNHNFGLQRGYGAFRIADYEGGDASSPEWHLVILRMAPCQSPDGIWHSGISDRLEGAKDARLVLAALRLPEWHLAFRR